MLQRYRINNCADIAEDGGGYCLSEDVAELEIELKKLTWISVKDRLPSKECEWYLISTKDGEGRKITTMAFFDLVGDDVLWLTHNDKESDSTEWDNVTDWQWLPEPAS